MTSKLYALIIVVLIISSINKEVGVMKSYKVEVYKGISKYTLSMEALNDKAIVDITTRIMGDAENIRKIEVTMEDKILSSTRDDTVLNQILNFIY